MQSGSQKVVAKNNKQFKSDPLDTKVNHRNGSGKTPLCWAASRGFTSTVQVLIGEGGADVDKPASVGCRSFTPLHYAAEKGHTAAVEVLLSHGANLDAPDRSGWTPLHTAAYNCKEARPLTFEPSPFITVSPFFVTLGRP